MKVKVALLVLAAALVFSAVAEAYYYIPFGQARRLSKVWMREACEDRGPSCLTWKVGHCARISAQRVDCAAGSSSAANTARWSSKTASAPTATGGSISAARAALHDPDRADR